MARFGRGWWMAAVAAVATCGCGDDSGGGDVPVEDVAELFAEAVCETIESCEPLFAVQFGGSCVESSTASLDNGAFAYLPAAIEAGTVVYDGSRTPTCIAAIRDTGCDLFRGARIPDVCHEAIVGQLAIGDSCSIDAQCEGSAVCLGTDSCPGTCSERIAEGGDCEDDDHCEDGLLCNGTCAPPRQEGDTCGGQLPACGGGLMCAGEDDQTGDPGACVAYDDVFVGAEGDSCDFMAGQFCKEGLACVIDVNEAGDMLTQVCGRPVGSGEPCKLAFLNHCPDGEYCDGVDPDAGSFDGTCKALPGDGAACASGVFAQCAQGRACVNGTCRTVRENGGSCADDAQCHSEHCDGDTCAPPPACDL